MSTHLLLDQEARHFFCNQIDKNVSLIAPAGVGKTHSIIQRILAYLQFQADKLLSQQQKLVVVTYTKKAAYEMEQRVRNALEIHFSSPKSNLTLNAHFFGTIHSFCLELLQKFGHYLHLPSEIKICTDESSLWLEYIRSPFFIRNSVTSTLPSKISSYCSIIDIYTLVKQLDYTLTPLPPLPEPTLSFDSILNFKSDNKRLQPGIEKEKAKLFEWIEAWNQNGMLEIPHPTAGGEAFIEQYNTVFRPLRDWVGRSLLNYAYALAQDFQAYRLQRGFLTYNDIIALAHRLLKNPQAHQEILSQNYSIILDEAQDSDRLQFEILLRCVTPYHPHALWPFDPLAREPLPGKLCIVGDPQQSIYGNRADLQTYLQLHEAFKNSNLASVCALEFSVTFRCAQSIVQSANVFFPHIFSKNKNAIGSASIHSVSYVTMQPRPSANLGQVCKYNLEIQEDLQSDQALHNLKEEASTSSSEKETLAYLEEQELQRIAQWLTTVTCADLQATDWSKVAILCPRNDWLQALARTLRRAHIPCQLHVKETKNGDKPLFAWITALMAIMVDPCNSYEIAGVLREVFGVKDSDMAHYVLQRHSSLKEIGLHPLTVWNETYLDETHSVGKILKSLTQLRTRVVQLPPRSAVEFIVSHTQLLERALALLNHTSPEEEAFNKEHIHSTYSHILTMAAQVEQENGMQAAFLEQLIQAYHEPFIDGYIKPGHLQLLTCHSAKGLEWDAILIPFFHRPISFKDNAYPRILIPRNPNLLPTVMVDAYHLHPDHEADRESIQLQELERLLYVAFTRARNTLLFIEDKALFKTNRNSFADLLRLATSKMSREHFDQLPTSLSQELTIQTVPPPSTSLTESSFSSFTPSLEILPTEIYLKGVQSSQNCTKKILHNQFNRSSYSSPSNASTIQENLLGSPSRSSTVRDLNYFTNENILPDSQTVTGKKTSERRTLARNYGTAWHRLLQHAPWQSPAYDLKCYFLKECEKGPFAERAQAEIQLFLQSSWFTLMSNPKVQIKTEVPILVKLESDDVYEGTIDLFMEIPMEKKIILLDWKTNLISSPQELHQLAVTYAPQLALYKTAITQVYKEHVEMHLYSTPLGLSTQIPASFTPNFKS